MVKFIEVDPDDVPNIREGRRGRVSYPILKSFLETGKTLVQLDRTGMQQGLQSLTSCLNAYIRSHELPIKMFTRGGQIYLMRLDLDEEGNPIANWQEHVTTEGAAGHEADMEARPLDLNEVAQRSAEERLKVTK